MLSVDRLLGGIDLSRARLFGGLGDGGWQAPEQLVVDLQAALCVEDRVREVGDAVIAQAL
jgi:hypothetical protein